MLRPGSMLLCALLASAGYHSARAQQTSPPATSTPTQPAETPALPATPGQDPDHAGDAKPLPAIESLLQQVERNEDRDEAAQREYTYRIHFLEESYDRDDNTKKTTTEERESFTVNGVRINRVTARDGKPLTPDQAAKESDRVDREVEKARSRKQNANSKGQPTDSNGNPIIPASRILELGTFSNEHRVLLEGRPTIVLDYAGNPQAKTHTAGEGVVRDLVGTVWIDEQDKVVTRAEGHFLKDFKMGAGLLVDIKAGTTFTRVLVRVNDEVWLTRELDGRGKASVLLFVRLHGHLHYDMSDFRKFRTSATLLPGTRQVDDQGRPLQDPPAASPAPEAPPTPPHKP